MDSSLLEDIDPLLFQLALPTGYETKYEHGAGCRDGYIKSELMDDLTRDFPEEDIKPILHIELNSSDMSTSECEPFQKDPLALAPRFSVENNMLGNLTEPKSSWEKLQLQIKQEVTETLSLSCNMSSVEMTESKTEESCANSSALVCNNDQSKSYFSFDKCGQAGQDNLCYSTCENITSTQPTPKKDIALYHSGIPQEEQCHNLTGSIVYSNDNGSHQQQWGKSLSDKLCRPQSNTGMLSPTINRIKKNLIEYTKFKIVCDSLAPKTKSDVCTDSLNDVSTQSPTLTTERPYCDLCKKLFSTNYHLTLHKQIHTGAKRYQCEVCKKSFTRKDSLHVHRRLHTGEKPYQCEFCTKTFVDRSTMVRHVRKHKGERQYKCNICGQSFYENGSLSAHLRNHSGERPFQCDVCKETFHVKSSMRRHVRGHNEERPHHCEICKTSFRFYSDLKVHIATHTGQRRHKCDVCKDTFNGISSLIKHKARHISEGHMRVMYSAVQAGDHIF